MPIPSAVTYDHRFVDAGGLSIHFVEVPSSHRAMILLHGIGMDWRVWQAISRRLRPHFRLYLVDLRGHGESQKPASGYTLAHYAADIEELIDALALDQVVLVGSSLGGMVAICVEAPVDIVSHRVLVDPPLTGGPLRDVEAFAEILRLKHGPVAPLADFLQEANPELARPLAMVMSEMWHQAADGVIVDLLAHAADYFNVDAALRSVDAPTLLLRADPTMHPSLTAAGAEHALRLLPRGSAQVVPGAGHAIHAFKPDLFVSAMLDYTAMSEEVPRMDRQ